MRRWLPILGLLFFAYPAHAQMQVPSFAADPATCNPIPGTMYFNTVSLTFKYCSATNVWSSIGSPAVVPATGSGKYFISTNCIGLTNCFTVKADVQAVSDATYTAGTGNVGTGTNDPPFCDGVSFPCTAAQIAVGHTTDVGMVAVGFRNCRAVNEMACDANCAQTTIASVTDAHDIVLTGTCTSNSTATANSNNFYWGSDDSTALTNAWTAAQNYAQFNGPTTVQLPCGRLGMGTPSFTFIPVGVMAYATGIEGCGEGNPTEIVPFPKMNCNTTNGCLLVLKYAQDALGNLSFNQTCRNILFNGYGLPDKDASATYNNPTAGIYAFQGVGLYNCGVQGWVWTRSTTTPAYGIQCVGCQAFGVNIYAGGNIDANLSDVNGYDAMLSGGSFGGSIGNSIVVTGKASTHGVYVNQDEAGCFTTAPCYGVLVKSTGTYSDLGSHITTGIWVDTAGANASLHGSIVDAVSSTYPWVVNGGILRLSGSYIEASGNQGDLIAGTVIDQCGNTNISITSGIVFTAGSVLMACPVGSDVQLAKAAAQAAKTVYTTTLLTTLYRVHLSVECTTTSAAATVTPSILYTDTSNTAQTVTGSAATCTTLNASSVTSQDVTFRAKNATAIQYQTVIANTPTYDISIVVEQMGYN